MSTNHLRQQAGGNPSQGPKGEMANPTPSPAAGEDFPDAPEPADAEVDQDQPDLDAFAERLGIDTDSGDETGAETPSAGSSGESADTGSSGSAVATTPDGESGTVASRAAELRDQASSQARTAGTKARSATGSAFRWLSERFRTLADRLDAD